MNIILIDEEIDESEVVRSLINRLEKIKEADLRKITNIDEAKIEVQKNKYDFIILDMMMHYGVQYDYQSSNGGLQTGSLFLRDLRDGKFGETNAETEVIVFSNFVDINVKNRLEKNYKNVKYIFKPQKKEVINIILRGTND